MGLPQFHKVARAPERLVGLFASGRARGLFGGCCSAANQGAGVVSLGRRWSLAAWVRRAPACRAVPSIVIRIHKVPLGAHGFTRLTVGLQLGWDSLGSTRGRGAGAAVWSPCSGKG